MAVELGAFSCSSLDAFTMKSAVFPSQTGLDVKLPSEKSSLSCEVITTGSKVSTIKIISKIFFRITIPDKYTTFD